MIVSTLKMSHRKSTPHIKRSSKEQEKLYTSFLDGTFHKNGSTRNRKMNGKHKLPPEHDISGDIVEPPFKAPRSEYISMPKLSRTISDGGKDVESNSKVPKDLIDLPAEQYFVEFKGILMNNDLFFVPHSNVTSTVTM